MKNNIANIYLITLIFIPAVIFSLIRFIITPLGILSIMLFGNIKPWKFTNFLFRAFE